MPKQRGHNEGSIYKRQDGLWCASVTVGRDPTGKLLRRTVYAKTRREVAAKLNELLNDKTQGQPLANLKKQTVQQYLEHWLETSVKTSCRPNTYANYGYSIRGHVLPAIGSLQLSKLGPQHIQQLLADMQAKGLTRMTTLTYAVLHRSLEQACKWRLIPSNPCSVVDVPRVASKDIAVLSADEAARFMQAAKGDRYYTLYFLALATAARQGELLGLKWPDIDFKEGMLAINRQLQWLKGGPVLAELKTAESRRTLPLPASCLAVLHEHKKAQAAARLAAGPLWQDTGLVFTTSTGGPVSPSGIRNRSFYAILAQAGLPRITFHGLRHTAATLLLSRGASVKHIQSQLGHSRINVTLDIYAHVLPDMKKEAARIMDGFLSKL